MSICKAIIQEGPRKGKQCTFTLKELDTDGYCGRHLRNKIYDDGILEGHRWCRFFFRGCNSQLDGIPEKVLSCDTCVGKKRGNKQKCQHSGCTDNAKDNEIFCGRHERDKYRLEEQLLGIRYCDIARGCFTICEDGLLSCEECLTKEQVRDKKRHQTNIQLNSALVVIAATTKRICSKCGDEFEQFKTKRNTESTKCEKCFETQNKVEKTRMGRIRNQKQEMFNNLERYYKEYITNAAKRYLDISITFDEFSELVQQKCYYCDYHKKGETNGIDRINNDIGYILSNCVPCCETCNYMKAFYHPQFFVEKCKIISKQRTVSQEFYEKWNIYYSRSICKSYMSYKHLTETVRNIPFNLTQNEWNKIIRQPCYLCGFQSSKGIGIDRVDNTIREYTLDNCKPCCGSCNSMKADSTLIDFIKHTLTIANKWIDTIELEIIPLFSNPYKLNVIIDTETNAIIEPEKTKRKKWFAKSLYNAILSNSENEYQELNKEIITVEEMEKLSNEIKEINDAKDALEKLSKYINTIKVRRARLKLKK